MIASKATSDFMSLQKPSGTIGDRVKKAIKATSQKFLPQAFLQEVRQYRSYAAAERPLYLRMRIFNGFGLTNPKRVRPPKTARSFIFVCFGNIMRSPMCEVLMTQALAAIPNAQITVTSAGLNAMPGRAAHPWAIAAAKEWSVSLENHRAKLLTNEMVDQADVIFAMDNQNRVQLLQRYARARNKVFMLSAYAGEDYQPLEIRDPYYAGEHGTRDCYKILDTCIRNLMVSLSGE